MLHIGNWLVFAWPAIGTLNPESTSPDFIAADRIREESECVLRYERSFLRPGLDGDLNA